MTRLRVAQFKHVEIGFTTIVEESMSKCETYSKGYAQVSEWVEVEFPPLSSALAVANELTALEDRETTRRLRFDLGTKQFEAEKARLQALLALPHGDTL